MFDLTNLRSTIQPKTDQLNSDSLLHGPMIITITALRGGAPPQDWIIEYEGGEGRPYKPCLTMRRAIVHAWGTDGSVYVGRSLTLYNLESVQFKDVITGGIRISHMTDIESDIRVKLTAKRGKKEVLEIKRMDRPVDNYLAEIRAATELGALKDAFRRAHSSTKDPAKLAAFKAESDARKLVLGVVA